MTENLIAKEEENKNETSDKDKRYMQYEEKVRRYDKG